jgi:misacylated tRNA(Ala) deacylase
VFAYGGRTRSKPPSPTDYHRIISPSLRHPSDTSITIPVGLLACQRTYRRDRLYQFLTILKLGDPLLRSWTPRSYRRLCLKPSPPSSVKKGSHTKQQKSLPSQLFRTLFFKSSCTTPFYSQRVEVNPTDIGTLTSEDGRVWNVELVKRHGGVAVHYVKSAEDIE